MGFFDWLTKPNGLTLPDLSASYANTGIVSPWSDGELGKIVWSDVFGTTAQFITRAEAMTIPAVVKARSIFVALIATRPLRSFDAEVEVATQPEWLSRTDGSISPFHRMAWTLDDIFFHGASLWGVERDADGNITAAERCPIELWKTDASGRILVNDKAVDSESVIYIPGPSEGLLTMASRSLRGAAALETAWIARAQSPIPAIELHETVESGVTADEAKDVVAAWAQARKDPNGAIAFTPYSIQANALGSSSADLFVEGRNFTKLDVANFFALPAALLDGSLSTASLTYSTQEGKRNELLDYAVPYWAGAIEGRLSQDDVVPKGERVRFDFSDLLTPVNSPIGATQED
ncbi:phage portal protein [Cryobacterium sinapicolor]|uniref:Phage portal protein n=1 Tax=Cryobacterium sinapicolor TaxID=1259236 RepID=A0ABY2ITL3_9MICO|nr:phage portal protein [Cryobacterium sinapicolor]TFC94569.1 phage portal protein [Cryobacterium sinapicolor]